MFLPARPILRVLRWHLAAMLNMAYTLTPEHADNDELAEAVSTLACKYLAHIATAHSTANEADRLGIVVCWTIDGPEYASASLQGHLQSWFGPECLMTEAESEAVRKRLMARAQDAAERSPDGGFQVRPWQPYRA